MTCTETRERRQLGSAAEAMTALRDVFGIDLSHVNGLEQQLSRKTFLA